jgi:Tol biopolymer transport system component
VGCADGRRFPACSPAGKWLAYESSQSGRNEVYVTPFPAGGAQYQADGKQPLNRVNTAIPARYDLTVLEESLPNGE